MGSASGRQVSEIKYQLKAIMLTGGSLCLSSSNDEQANWVYKKGALKPSLTTSYCLKGLLLAGPETWKGDVLSHSLFSGNICYSNLFPFEGNSTAHH